MNSYQSAGTSVTCVHLIAVILAATQEAEVGGTQVQGPLGLQWIVPTQTILPHKQKVKRGLGDTTRCKMLASQIHTPPPPYNVGTNQDQKPLTTNIPNKEKGTVYGSLGPLQNPRYGRFDITHRYSAWAGPASFSLSLTNSALFLPVFLPVWSRVGVSMGAHKATAGPHTPPLLSSQLT